MANLRGDAKQTYVADLFARIAGRYDLMNSLMTGGMHHRWKAQTARSAAHNLTGPALDIATGTGDLAFALSRRPGIGPAIGVDLLPEMVSIARQKRRRAGPGTAVGFLVGGRPWPSPFPTTPLPAPPPASASAICPTCRRPWPKWPG